jgi:alpha-glucosidase (family GH31 glycosyl hydrolase)
MDGWRDFTFHPENYPLPEMQRFVEQLHQNDQRWVPIVDPGIKVDPGYAPYDEGSKADIWMKGVDGKPYLAWVWAGATHFPDFFLPRARDYFTRLLKEHRGLVPWDGIWIDMDEVSNFCTGDICQLRSDAATTHDGTLSVAQLHDDPPWVCHLDCWEASDINDTQRAWLNPPYAISNSLSRLPLGFKSMSVLATHHDGSVEYNTHNLYGLSECLTTHDAVKEVTGKRPFVLSRSSFTGTGSYAGHWTGDNSATWDQLAQSIPGVLNIGLWGIPFAGADICGFQGDTTPELCARWVSLGAFYPFSRSHSDLHSSYQELYRWPEVAAAGKRALGMRYKLLPYLYTAVHAAAATGAPIMRPVWFNFPQDRHTHHIDRQFMVGDALLVSPVLEQGADTVEAYFPPGTWHSLWEDGETIDAGKDGKTVKLEAPLGEIPLHMLGGKALLMHSQPGLTTADTKRSPLVAVVALPAVLEGNLPDGYTLPLLGAEEGQQSISWTMYNDGGEEPEAGTSHCNFLTLTATFERAADGRHSGEVLLQFGSPSHLRSGSAGGKCEPVADAEAAAASELEWPALGGVRVLGWRVPANGAAVELVQRSNACELAVTERLALPTSAATAGSEGLHIDLASLNLQLKCGVGVRVSWAQAAAPTSGGGAAASA